MGDTATAKAPEDPRTYLTRAIGSLIALTNVVFLLPVWFLGNHRATVLGMVFVCLYVAGALSTYITRRADLAAHFLASCGLVHILLAVSFTGGVRSAAALTSLLIPTGAALMIGMRAGWLWMVLSLTGLAVLNLGHDTLVLGQPSDLDPVTRGWLHLVTLVPTFACLLAAMAVFAHQRTHAQTALHDALADLEERVRTRTVELRIEVEQRRVAEKRADDANRAKTAFLMNMSHELRTPLNVIQGYAELLSDELDDPSSSGDPQDDLDQIVSASKHLLDLIDGILEFARVEAGELTCTPEVLDVPALASDLVTLLRPVVLSRGNTLHLTEDSVAEATVWADAAWVRQILINLVTNATKYTDSGTIRLRVRRTDAVTAVAVVDDGPGIEPDLLPRLFDRFTRGSRVSASGSGLGLAISSDLAERMGGRLTVASTLGAGSTFELELPNLAGVEERAGRADPPG
jgi:signal transduction histidine kinase